ncbi:MFS transporter [Mycetocola sp. JXN-3]|uniref:MFS transporter n=1 Tax=Mycetocola sp. JXN-3 TaxID=2116510 RepID=UPI00165D0EA0|nr:MFS transporter [Mycetocola sp. JXN-3]
MSLPTPSGTVPMRRILAFSLLELVALGSLATPLVVGLSLRVLQLVPESGKEAGLAAVTAAGAIAALLSNPIFGYLSDRTTSRFGRRRPWLVAGTALGLLGALIATFAPNLAVLVAAWVIAQIGYNAALASLSALLADQIPEHQRARASGLFGAFGFLGLVPALLVSTIFSGSIPVIMLFMPVVAVIVTVLVCWKIPDPAVDASAVPKVRLRTVFTAMFVNPFTYPLFTLAWIQRFAMQFGYTVVGTFGLFYLMLRLGLDVPHATPLVTLSTLVGATLNFVAAFAGGYLASRRGNYVPFLVGSAVLLAITLLMKAFTDSLSIFWISTALAGFALGCYYAVDLAIALRTIPARDAGRYLGVFNVAKTLPQSLAPIAAPLIIMIGHGDPISGGDKNYAALYIVAAVLVLGSLITVPWLMPALRRSKTEQAAAGVGTDVPAAEVRA